MSHNRRDFLRNLFFTGATAVVAPTSLVKVAVGFDRSPGGIITRFNDPYADFWAKHAGVASDISQDQLEDFYRAAERRRLNEALFSDIASHIDAVNDFLRIKMREEGFYRKIIPPCDVEFCQCRR